MTRSAPKYSNGKWPVRRSRTPWRQGGPDAVGPCIIRVARAFNDLGLCASAACPKLFSFWGVAEDVPSVTFRPGFAGPPRTCRAVEGVSSRPTLRKNDPRASRHSISVWRGAFQFHSFSVSTGNTVKTSYPSNWASRADGMSNASERCVLGNQSKKPGSNRHRWSARSELHRLLRS
jgi:hypothetical protein